VSRDGERQSRARSAAAAVERIDHLVLTVRDLDATTDFYDRVLGMEVVRFGESRVALRFGTQKLNLHAAGREIEPHASSPTPGSTDLCLIVRTPVDEVVARLVDLGVAAELGPVERDGAISPLRSVYLRDPDGNLVELANEA
jgi:catechol 2,3-dioxygenase-like lactoylglutathione lyase family enzyme